MNELKEKLLKTINESQLPVEAILFVVKDLYRDVDDVYKAFLQQQKDNENKEDKQEEDEK